MRKQTRGIVIYLVVIVAMLFIYQYAMSGLLTDDSYTYEMYEKALEEDLVEQVAIQPNKEVPTGEIIVSLKDGDTKQFYDTDVNDAKNLAKEYGVEVIVYDVPTESIFLTTILPILLTAVIVFILFTLMNRQGNGGANAKMMNFGKSRARMSTDADKKITFKDVAGLDEEKEDLVEIVDFLKNPGKYTRVGARIPKGVLLVGPPGTGKTLIAKAVAGEAGVPFFSISGSDFVEMFVGVGASRVRDLFEDAKKHHPCIVFIDEIDAVARRRGSGLGGGHDESEQTLNQLLVEMDGFGVNEGIIVMAATNRVDI